MGELLEASGTLGTMILGLAVVASLVALAAGGLAFSKKRRVPLAAMVVLPMFTIVLGAFGAYSAANGTYAELAAAAPNDMAQVAIDGMWNAMAVDTLSRWVAAFVFALSAWACSLGALAAGDDTLSLIHI